MSFSRLSKGIKFCQPISKAPLTLRFLQNEQRMFSTKEGSGAPYRPWPFDQYFWPKSAEFFKSKCPPMSEKNDEYENESVYLDEMEDRMRKYDSKYASPQRVKDLYNEFGFDDWDDRAYHANGGGNTSAELQYGRGKKIDPSRYINPEPVMIQRKALPPLEQMTAEQVRRARGQLASFREVPSESPSVLKFWNGYSMLALFGGLVLTKEFMYFGGHDMQEIICVWGVFAVLGSIIGDNMAWWHTLQTQERYDREYLLLKQQSDQVNEFLEKLRTKPDEVKMMHRLMLYRESLSQKVLKKTLSNRVTRIVDSTLAKLENKLSEEQTLKREAENSWKREALENTLSYFEISDVQNNFMQEALRQFTEGNVAALGKSTTLTLMKTDMFQEKYNDNYNNAKQIYVSEQEKKGTLNWVFKSKQEIETHKMSSSQKVQEYEKRISDWANTHNSVNVPVPSF